MADLAHHRYGKSGIRVSKVLAGEGWHDLCDVEVRIVIEGNMEASYVAGDNSAVIPTDTMRNTVYALAQEHLSRNLERFASVLAHHFLDRPAVGQVEAAVVERRWERAGSHGFVGGGSERRTARTVAGPAGDTSWGGIEGLVVLKTEGSAFSGFPRDELTTLAETEDRVLATTVRAEWRYQQQVPPDPVALGESVRATLLDRFFADPSRSVQHQGWMMASAVIEAHPDLAAVTLWLPNQHHLAFDLTRFGLPPTPPVFHPVTEPYGDIAFTVAR